MKRIFRLLSFLLFTFAFIYGVGLIMDKGILHDFSNALTDYMNIISLFALIIGILGIIIDRKNINNGSIIILIIGIVLPFLYDVFNAGDFNIGKILNVYPYEYLFKFLTAPITLVFALLIELTFKISIYILILLFLLFGIFYIVIKTKVTNTISNVLRFILLLFEGAYILSSITIIIYSLLNHNPPVLFTKFLIGTSTLSSVMIYFLLPIFFMANIGFVEEESITNKLEN